MWRPNAKTLSCGSDIAHPQREALASVQLNNELQHRQTGPDTHLKVKAGVLASLVGHWADLTVLPQWCSKDVGLDALQHQRHHLSTNKLCKPHQICSQHFWVPRSNNHSEPMRSAVVVRWVPAQTQGSDTMHQRAPAQRAPALDSPDASHLQGCTRERLHWTL